MPPRPTGTCAYNTAWFGKMHNVPDWMSSKAGPFDFWPTGLGFEYFYGFLGGDSDNWHPALYENIQAVEPYMGKPGYILSTDLADKAINWLRMHSAGLAPGRGRPTATHRFVDAVTGDRRRDEGPVMHTAIRDQTSEIDPENPAPSSPTTSVISYMVFSFCGACLCLGVFGPLGPVGSELRRSACRCPQLVECGLNPLRKQLRVGKSC